MLEITGNAVARKISFISILSEKYEEKRRSRSKSLEKVPKDTLYLVHILAIAFGFMNMMPAYFFSMSTNYWMYKFRNSSSDAAYTEGANRTPLQSYFQSVSMISAIVPVAICTFGSTFWGHKATAMIRTIVSLVGLIVIFAIFAIFTQVDTDNWQTVFFIITMTLLFLNVGFLVCFQMSSIILISKLTEEYVFYFLLGQSGTIFTTLLQIMCISITDSSATAACIYFTIGFFLIIISLILLFLSRKTAIFKYYDVEDIQFNTEPKKYTIAKLWGQAKQIWPSQVIVVLYFFILYTVHPSLNTLVVSEYEAEHTLWTDKYFTLVAVFVMFDLSGIVSKIVTKNFRITAENKWYYIIIFTLLFSLIIPGFMFCNAQPRTRLPVLFKHDWQFILLSIIFSGLIAAAQSISQMSLESLSNDLEEAFIVCYLVMAVSQCLTGFNGILAVKLL